MSSELLAPLREAVRDCSERCLYKASKWASELLLSTSLSQKRVAAMTPQHTHTSVPAHPGPSGESMRLDVGSEATQNDPSHPVLPTSDLSYNPDAPELRSQPPEVREREMELESIEADYIAAARSMFDAKEFTRVAYWLRDCQSSKAIFMRVYSEYMASEKNALREWYRMDKTRNQPHKPVNSSIVNLLQSVQNSTDPWLLFLKSLFLHRLSRRDEAIEAAMLSIAGYPWNWSVWLLLSDCIEDGDELLSLLPLLSLPATHVLVQLFQIKTLNTLGNPSEAELSLCDKLLSEEFFPESSWLMAQRACVLYHMHEYGSAETQFRKIREKDPYRIDDIDILSNVLYVSEKRLELSRLAHEVLALERDRPEICCLVGNHYSLHLDHEKAIKYFKRATQLDRTYLSAWILMGHEYVEMKNSHAAIESYRKAVDVDRKDYRAWYGLGQAYELLNMHQYAVYYYQHATALRPYDVRLWQAQAICYEEMGRIRESIECNKRALIGAGPKETNIHLRLAKLHNDLGEFRDAAAYHQRIIDTGKEAEKNVNEYASSCVYVARYHLLHGGGDLFHARDLMESVASSQSEEVAQAADLLKRIRAAIAAKQQADAARASQAGGT
ncbi:TPR-like protein [Panus rudis PR-1116 ss-1]|nr:TPR-like protein [Panus rudis PR-1116 ss-1]